MMVWMTIWIVLLVVGVVGFVILLLMVGAGAVRELKEMLAELREDRSHSDKYSQSLDEAI